MPLLNIKEAFWHRGKGGGHGGEVVSLLKLFYLSSLRRKARWVNQKTLIEYIIRPPFLELLSVDINKTDYQKMSLSPTYPYSMETPNPVRQLIDA